MLYFALNPLPFVILAIYIFLILKLFFPFCVFATHEVISTARPPSFYESCMHWHSWEWAQYFCEPNARAVGGG